MRIVLDMQGAQGDSRFRGIGRYALALARALLADPAGHEFHLLLNAHLPDGEAVMPEIPGARIHVMDLPGPVAERDPANAWRMQAAELVREHILGEMAADLVVTMSPCEGIANDIVTSAGQLGGGPATAAVLYDLIPLQRPDLYLANPHVRRAYLRRMQALRQTDLLLAISQATRQAAIRLLDIPAQRVVVIGAGVDPFFRPTPGDAARLGLSRRFVLYTGAADPRKNLDGLIAAYALLPPGLRATHQLALAGRLDAAESRAIAAMARKRGLAADALVCLGYVADAVLRQLYSTCAAFVFPSLHEGFGLPALEAMACGAPTIASDTSSMPEVIGRADAMFDPTRPEAIAARLRAVLEDAGFAASLRESGLRTARGFTWQATAGRALGAFAVLQPGSRRRRPSLAFVASGPTGLAVRLLPALARQYDITWIAGTAAPDQHALAATFPLRDGPWFARHHARFDRVLYQCADTPAHRFMLPLLAACPGVVVLEDFFLGHMMGGGAALYESHGYPALLHARAEGAAAAMQAFPANAAVLRQALRVLSPAPDAVALARHWYGDAAAASLRIIPFLPPTPPAQLPAREAARARLALAEDTLLVCAFSQAHRDRLQEAWRLSPPGADARCRLVFVTDRYADHLAAADAAVQLCAASRGRADAALVDCLEHGVPVLANALGTAAALPAEVVLRVPAEFSDAALAAALTALHADAAGRAAQAERARAWIGSAYHPEAVAECCFREIEDAYATSPLAREQALLAGIGRIATAAPAAGDLAACATAIAANRPAGWQPRLLVDVSAPAEGLALTLLTEWLRTPPPGWRVEPVRAAGDGFLHACRFTCDLLCLGETGLTDEPVEALPGDLFLALQGGAQALPVDWLRAQRRRGVGVVCVADAPSARPCPWLAQAAALADGILCLSAAAMHDLADCLAAQGWRRPKSGWFHPGAEPSLAAILAGGWQMPGTAAAPPAGSLAAQ